MGRGFISRLLKPKLDPGRVGRAMRRFDRDCGYERFHAHCRDRLRREVPAVETALEARGFEHLRVWTEAEAARVLTRVRDDFDADGFRRNADRVRSYRIDDAGFVRQLLESVFTPEVDARILRFFRSEYFMHWFVVTRTEPRPNENFNSFLWHCDRGPSAHLKLLVYLNGYEEHRGSTHFLDLAATRDFAPSGYLFGAVADRREELPSLASGVDYRPHRWCARAGEAALFQPRNVLHRGVMPSHAARYVLAICLLPSPVPWREAFELGWASDLRHDRKWHRDAWDVTRSAATA